MSTGQGCLLIAHRQQTPKQAAGLQILRLSAKGWTIPQIAQHVQRHPETVRLDIVRWEERGVAGLADVPAPGKTPIITKEMEQFLNTKLNEARTWDCTSLQEALREAFGVKVSREALRVKLHCLGYRWKRTRYLPEQAPHKEAEAQARGELAELKKGGSSGPTRPELSE